jgi:hypothetical protein
MAKEYDVIEVGYIGSFIDERADNDGYDLKKSISLGVPDNNVWVVNPRTGVLESVVSKGDTNDPQFVQFNGTKPTNPTTDLVIKNIGKTIKVINTFYTEVCVSESFSGSNYTYTYGQSIPNQYKSCEKTVYFTSNNMINWPTALQTQDMLSNLSKKIPYDIGFSKREYKIGKLTHKQLMEVEKQTSISYNFLKNLSCLFLFDTEYPNNIEYSNIKLGYDWDGFSIDKNDANNLVYSDYHKKTNVENANYVFLVTDRHIEELTKYFKEFVGDKPVGFRPKEYYDPTEYIKTLRTEKSKYGKIHSFIKNSDTFNVGIYSEVNPNLEEILDTLTTKQIYNVEPEITDIDLVEDYAVTNFFLEIQAQITITSISDTLDIGDGEAEPTQPDLTQTDSFDILYAEMTDTFSRYKLENAYSIGIINGKLYNLIHKYISLQKKYSYPLISEIPVKFNEFNSIPMDDPFILTGLTESTVAIQQGPSDLNTTRVSNATPISSIASIYKSFDFANDYSISDQIYKTKPLFLADSDRTNQFFSSTLNETTAKYYMSVYNRPLSDIRSKKIFDIAYAHISGSGSSHISTNLNIEIENFPSKGMYKKYMAECFNGVDRIKFKNGNESDYFYALQFDRDAFKDKLNTGNIQISLSPLSSNPNQLINTGSNFQIDVSSSTIFTLIDDSMHTMIYSSSFETSDECYNLVSGTIQDGPVDYENSEGWGLVFPNKGLILLNGEMLDASCSFNTVTASIDGDNPRKLFLSLSGSCSPNLVRDSGSHWYMRSSELYADQNFFCRINRNEFNYSNNYTYVSGSTWKVYYDKLNNGTKTYITTIGLYNQRNELLAIGKFSRPFLKDSTQEYVINVKVRYT